MLARHRSWLTLLKAQRLTRSHSSYFFLSALTIILELKEKNNSIALGFRIGLAGTTNDQNSRLYYLFLSATVLAVRRKEMKDAAS